MIMFTFYYLQKSSNNLIINTYFVLFPAVIRRVLEILNGRKKIKKCDKSGKSLTDNWPSATPIRPIIIAGSSNHLCYWLKSQGKARNLLHHSPSVVTVLDTESKLDGQTLLLCQRIGFTTVLYWPKLSFSMARS